MHQDIARRNHITVSGQGKRTLVFAAGFGCDQRVWRKVAPAFEQEYRVVLFDYTGTGRSEFDHYPRGKYSDLSGYAQDVIDVIRAACPDEPVTLVGHSVSAMIGLIASIAEPALFEKLVMIAPSPCYRNDPPYIGGFERADLQGLLDLMETNYNGWANYLAGLVIQNPDRPELEAELEESFCAMEPSIARNFAQATFFSDSRSECPRATVPSLILACAEDVLVPAEVGRYLQRHMPRSDLRILETKGHNPHMSDPEMTIRGIRDYLEGDC